MPRLTKAEKEAGIGFKCLVIVRNHYKDGEIAKVMSPSACAYWKNDGATWMIDAHECPTENNSAGIYAAYTVKEASRYTGTLCKVILSGTVIEHEKGARGERARLLEIYEDW